MVRCPLHEDVSEPDELGRGLRFQKPTSSLKSLIFVIAMASPPFPASQYSYPGGCGITALTSVRWTIHSPSTLSRMARW